PPLLAYQCDLPDGAADIVGTAAAANVASCARWLFGVPTDRVRRNPRTACHRGPRNRWRDARQAGLHARRPSSPIEEWAESPAEAERPDPRNRRRPITGGMTSGDRACSAGE